MGPRRETQGPAGPRGPEGPQGPEGPPGTVAEEHIQDIVERIFVKISENPEPFRGPRGADGLAGPAGPPGRDGSPGPRGERGEQGEPGPPGESIEITDELIAAIVAKLPPVVLQIRDGEQVFLQSKPLGEAIKLRVTGLLDAERTP